MGVAMTVRETLRRVGIDLGRWPRPHDDFVLDGALAAVLYAQAVNCVLDVGANIGQFARKIRAIGYTGRIVSFEPSPVALPRLQAAAESDANWIVRPVGLAAQAGTAELHLYEGSDFNSLHAALPTGRARFSALAEVGTASVTLTTLAAEHPDAVAGIAAPRILLKSDTQCHDLDVLAGDPGLPDVVAVLVEMSAQAIYEDQPHMSKTIDILSADGFMPVAFQPVNRASDRLRVIEFDGLFMRSISH
jgi:FkbM family methyltransferase